MTTLNDDDLNSLLREAKDNPPKPSAGLTNRTVQAYERKFHRSSIWRRLLFGTVRLPIPAVVLACILLLVAGAELGQRVRHQDRPVLNIYGLQPVTDLHLRIVRRAHEDR